MGAKTIASYQETIQSFLTVYRYLRQYGRKMRGEGLSGRAVSILRYLLDAGPLTISQCRDYLYINDSSTSELISNLERDGYVTRSRSQTDSRSVIVALTPYGVTMANSVVLGGIPLLREKLKSLSPEKLGCIHQAMREIQAALEVDKDA